MGSACYLPAMAKPSLTVLPGWDMYEFHLAAVAALRKAGLHDEARELHQRGWTCHPSTTCGNWSWST